MTICFGNHDPGLEQFLYPKEIAPASGISIDGTSYMHGHTRPARKFAGTLIICGHHHPTVGLYDGIGIGFKTPCFVLAKLDDDIWHGKKNNDKNDTITDPIYEKETGSRKKGKSKKQKKDEISEIRENRETRVLLMPAFNECVGYDLRRTLIRPFSAISRAIEKNSAEVMLIDGTYAGDMVHLVGYLEG
jgi:metallophosphoesterase superfamily enzyme